MAEASIPVDLWNPGQVFACIGFVEASNTLLGDAEGAFDWSDPGDVRFWLRARGDDSPVERVLAFLERANAIAVAPEGSESLAGWLDSWGPRPLETKRAHGYPFPEPETPATLVCVIRDESHSITLDHWGDTERDNVKFWAGARGYPGSALARDALALIAGRAGAAASEPFGFAATQSSSFRLDWRRDYIPIDSGFSLNRHVNIETLGFPIVELLAAIGLTHARPKRPDRRNKLEYIYGIIGRERPDERIWLPPSILRVALGATSLPFPSRRFRMLLDWPGQEGQARSITAVTEETTA